LVEGWLIGRILFHEQGEENLQQPDEEAQGGADDFHEPEFFGKDLVQHNFQPVGGEVGNFVDDDLFQVEVVFEVCHIVFHDDGEKVFQFFHEDGFELADGFVADEHGDHGHAFF